MIIHKVIRKGSDHLVYCQDSLSIGETNKYLFCSIQDGCSGGKDSHFASSLFGKAFDHTIKNYNYALDGLRLNIEESVKFFIHMMSRKISEVKHVLHLDVIELLSTLVFCAINKETNR